MTALELILAKIVENDQMVLHYIKGLNLSNFSRGEKQYPRTGGVSALSSFTF